MNIELLDTNLNGRRISQDFEIGLDTQAGKKTIVVNKWVEETDYETNSDTAIVDGLDVYEALSDEEQAEVDDFISDLTF